MGKYFYTRAGRLFLIDVIAIALTLIALPVLASTNDEPETKASFSQGRFIDGEKGSGNVPNAESLVSSKTRQSIVAESLDPAFRIYDADVYLYYDDDRDGHFYGIDVRFDADTDYFGADVYARLYLSFEGGPWEHYYTTEYFTIFGASGVDDYLVETELYSGYPTGYYDVLIELYDDFGFIVARIGPEDTSALSVLPLEDQVMDTPYVAPVGGLSVSRGGGGAIGIVSLLPLALLGLARRLKNRG